MLMRIFKVVFVMLLFSVCAHAQDYSYMAFQKADGSKITVGVENLNMTFADGLLHVESDSGTQDIPVSELSMMFFTNDAPTVIAETENVASHAKQVYSISGTFVGTFDTDSAVRQSCGKGVYLIKDNGKTSKVVIR